MRRLSFKLVQDYERSLMFYKGSQRGHNIAFHLIHMFLFPGPRSPICTSGERCQRRGRSCPEEEEGDISLGGRSLVASPVTVCP
ncbi:hypothetical protein L596_010453 [Steinernema carpocapsae]|uniref:Uncharacterized protein n=1 Tax=Steinernema carpocapsae TaxID=34508 RepID=A0A4U5PIL7_STECR|nr:hypothetical protein L596_010453 [Steinernema carpocapsae]